MNIEIGAPVRTQDRAEVGHVHRVVVDLEQEAVVSIVVLKGRLLPRDILVPLDFVDAANSDGVTLRLSRSELDHLPNFSYNQVFSPPPTWTLPGGTWPSCTSTGPTCPRPWSAAAAPAWRPSARHGGSATPAAGSPRTSSASTSARGG